MSETPETKQVPADISAAIRAKRRVPENDTLEAQKAEIEQQIESSPHRDAIRAALESGRERLDPRKAEEAAREGGRIPLGMKRARLDSSGYGDQLEGYVGLWVLDDGNMVVDAIRAGYLPVFKDPQAAESDDLGTWVSAYAGPDRTGRPMRQYLMKQRKDLHDLDDRARSARDRELMDSVLSGGLNKGPHSYGKIGVSVE